MSDLDDEVRAMAAVADALKPLDERSRRRVMEWVTSSFSPVQPKSPGSGRQKTGSNSHSIAVVIRRLMLASPDGLTMPQIVTGVRGKYETMSDNPDQLCRTRIGQMVKRGELVRDGDVIRIAESAGATRTHHTERRQ